MFYIRADGNPEIGMGHVMRCLSIADALTLKAQQATPQGAGSACTYGRRFSLSAALGVAWDDDDDGNAASTPPKAEKKAAPKAKAKEEPKAPRKVESLRAIAAAAKEIGVTNDDIKEVMRRHYNKSASSELTDTEAAEMEKNFVGWVAEVKDDDNALMEGIA